MYREKYTTRLRCRAADKTICLVWDEYKNLLVHINYNVYSAVIFAYLTHLLSILNLHLKFYHQNDSHKQRMVTQEYQVEIMHQYTPLPMRALKLTKNAQILRWL